MDSSAASPANEAARSATKGPRDGGDVSAPDAAKSSGGSTGPNEPASSEEDTPGTLRSIPLDAIRPNPHQPRQDFDPEALEALATSIRSAGLMQPIVVRPVPRDGSVEFEIVAGERRFRAARLVPLASVPAVVREVDDRTSAEWALVENLQREDLNAIERANAFRRLSHEFKLTHQEIAESVGLDRASVSNHLRLLALDEETQGDVRSGRLGMGHARALLAVDDVSQRRAIAGVVIDEALSVRELERRVRAARQSGAEGHTPDPSDPAAGAPPQDGKPDGRAALDATRVHMDDLERRLGEHLGTRVRIKTGRAKGTGEVRIQFFTLDEFEGLMDRMGFDPS